MFQGKFSPKTSQFEACRLKYVINDRQTKIGSTDDVMFAADLVDAVSSLATQLKRNGTIRKPCRLKVAAAGGGGMRGEHAVMKDKLCDKIRR